jgi:hypothetical protein
MARKTLNWSVLCDEQVFRRCQQDPKFPFIVALARAVNALNSSHSLIIRSHKVDTPEVVRNRMNSFFFSSALMYEGLVLIRKMKKLFGGEAAYESGLRMLLRNPLVQRLEQMHLHAARNHAVFHFLPDKFEEAIKREKHPSCTFIAAHGTKNRAVHFSYADVVAAEMLIGISSDNEKEFWPAVRKASKETGEAVMMFAKASEELMVQYLNAMGFRQQR